MVYQINYGNFAFAVPGAAVDHFIRLAGATELKILLYYLRHAGEAVTAESAAQFLHIEPEQAEAALQFWVQADVLRQGLEPSAMPFSMPINAPASVPEPPAEPEPVLPSQRSSKDFKMTPQEISEEIEKSSVLADLFSLAEKRLGKPLNYTESNSLIWMHQYLNIPSEVILMLIEYSVTVEKYSISYVESIAIRWHAEGITTLPQAEEELQRMTRRHSFENEIRKLFEMKHSPTTRQRSYLELWQKIGYPMELIRYAYEITIENIEKLDFKYINTILESWAENGIRDLTAAQQFRTKSAPPKKKRSREKTLSPREVEEMNDYLSVVNRLVKEDPNG